MFRNPFHRTPDGPQEWLVSPRGPIRRERVSTAEAFARWQGHRDAFPATGLWPVMVPPAHVENLEETFRANAGNVEAEVAAGVALDAPALLARWLEERLADEAEEEEELRTDLRFAPADLARTERPPVEAQIGATSRFTQASGAARGLWIALVPCRAPWEVPAVMGYGGWNDCPPPAEQVAVLRHWHAAHDAEPLVVGSDTLELLVRPVADPTEAKRVATEQFAYCSDVAEQDAGSVAELATDLLDASVWFFWWD